MTATIFFLTFLFSLTPIFELRFALPFALANGASAPAAYLVAVAANMLVAPLVFLFLETMHKLFMHWSFYRGLFERVIIRVRKKMQTKIEKYGYIGITLFVAIPLPVTGAYTGILGAWLLGLGRRNSILAACLGVMISGAVVLAVALLGIELFEIFIKKAH